VRKGEREYMTADEDEMCRNVRRMVVGGRQRGDEMRRTGLPVAGHLTKD
jgi:hypothetical protein